MSEISSYVVNKDGEVLNFQGKKVKKAPQFLIGDINIKGLVREIPEVSKYPSVIRYINDILNSMYRMKNERVSLTEKNKGSEYPASSFTITTNFEEVVSFTNTEIGTEKAFTIKKGSQLLKECLSEVGKESTYFNIKKIEDVKNQEKDHKLPEKDVEKAGGYEQALFSVINNDMALNECAKFKKGWFWIVYNPFTIKLKEDTFKLSDNHKIRYVSFVTKFIENVSNLSSPQEVSLKERNVLIQKYELFLFEILEQYFNIENIKI